MTRLIRYKHLLPFLCLFVSAVCGNALASGQSEEKIQYNEALDAARQRDITFAIEQWRTLAKKGYADAQYRLGVLCRTGNTVKKDFTKAFQWFKRAAEQGHADAQYNLGMMYLRGWGTPRDMKQASHWLESAAAQGVAIARLKLQNSINRDALSPIDPAILSGNTRNKPVNRTTNNLEMP